MMPSRELPEQLIAKYRTVSLSRLDQMESCWNELRLRRNDPQREVDLGRHVRALKSDSRALGFNDVNFVCQKMEDLLFFARQRRYDVPDELDVLVTMALQFMAMLVRRKLGAPLTGVDLTGFVRQLEEVLRSAQAAPVDSGPGPSPVELQADRISTRSRQRLARIATSVYLESLNAWGPSVVRLRAAWEGLVRETNNLEAVPLVAVLAPGREAALELARAQDKQVEIFLDVGAHRAVAEVAEALREAVGCALHHAVERGVEPPAQRAGAGKREIATLRVRAREEGDRLEVVVEDDGGGANLDAIRRRGVELGLFSAQVAEEVPEEELVQLLLRPDFGRRDDAGRAGLGAARAAVAKVGGTAELWSRSGVGTSVVLRTPQVIRTVRVLRLALPGSPHPFAIPATWAVISGPSDAGVGPTPRLDPLLSLGLPRGEEPGRREVVRLRRDEMEVELVCRARPMLGTADRICATDDDWPTEVVRVDGTEALLIRPERLIPASASAKA